MAAERPGMVDSAVATNHERRAVRPVGPRLGGQAFGETAEGRSLGIDGETHMPVGKDALQFVETFADNSEDPGARMLELLGKGLIGPDLGFGFLLAGRTEEDD